MKDKPHSVKRRGRPFAAAVGDTREHLLDAATRLFSEQGVSATSVAEIAAAVGVTSAMVHYYFKTRERLLDAVVEERIGIFVSVIEEHVGKSNDPFIMVRGLVERIVETTVQIPWLPALWIREIASEGGQLRERLLKLLPVDMQNHFSVCIAEGQKRGVVNAKLNPQLLFVSIIGQTLFPLAVSKVWRQFPSLERFCDEAFVDHATSLLLFGMRGEPRVARGDR